MSKICKEEIAEIQDIIDKKAQSISKTYVFFGNKYEGHYVFSKKSANFYRMLKISKNKYEIFCFGKYSEMSDQNNKELIFYAAGKLWDKIKSRIDAEKLPPRFRRFLKT